MKWPTAARIVLHLSCLLGASAAAKSAAQPAAPASEVTQPSDAPHLLPAVEEPGLRGQLAEQRDSFGRRCSLQGLAASGALRIVACGPAGLWLFRILPTGAAMLVTQRAFEGSVSGLFLRDLKLWVQISSVRAQPIFAESELEGVQELAGAPLPAFQPMPPVPAPITAPRRLLPPPPPPIAARRRVPVDGKVIAIEPGYAIVNLGLEELSRGSHVAFFSVTRETGAGFEDSDRREQIAVGEVVSVAETRSRVQLGLGETVPVGSGAEPATAQLSASTFAPPRVAGSWELGFLLRGFLVLDDLGVGAFLDARVGYRMLAPVHFEALLSPFAVASARRGATVPAAAVVTASFDSRLFELGLGVGGQTVNDPDVSLDPGSGTSIAQRVRLGARDGLNLEVFSYIALFHSRFNFSFLRLQAQIPLGHRAWLLAAGGGGDLGLGFGELGLRVLTSGNGGPGSFFLTTVIGGVNVFRGCEVVNNACSSLDYSGPMVGMGGEWRP